MERKRYTPEHEIGALPRSIRAPPPSYRGEPSVVPETKRETRHRPGPR